MSDSDTDVFFNSVKLQIEFLRDLRKNIDKEDVGKFCDLIYSNVNKYLAGVDKPLEVLALASGRSLISLRSFSDRIESMYKNARVFTPEQARNVQDLDLVIFNTASGSGSNLVSYVDDIRKAKVPVLIVTESGKSDLLDGFEGYDSKYLIRVPEYPETVKDNLYIKTLYSPLGSEFELKTFALFASAFDQISDIFDSYRTGDISNPDLLCQTFYDCLDEFTDNAELLMSIDKDPVSNWIEQVFPRSGYIVPYGFGNSALVSDAFGMRLTHLGKDVSLLGQPNRPDYRRGDIFCPMSGSGDTPEVVNEFRKVWRADKAAITVNKDSKLVELMKESGDADNILYIPVLEDKTDLYKSRTSRLFSFDRDVLQRPLYFEMNLYIVLNAMVAQAAFNEGKTVKSMRIIHVK